MSLCQYCNKEMQLTSKICPSCGAINDVSEQNHIENNHEKSVLNQPDSFLDYYIYGFKNYRNFKGRARRKEYWGFILISSLIGIVISIPEIVILSHQKSVLGSLYNAIVALPTLAVTIRRLHDTNRSAWWWIAPLILILLGAIISGLSIQSQNQGVATIGLGILIAGGIGSLMTFVYLCFNGDKGANQYGEDPKQNENNLQD